MNPNATRDFLLGLLFFGSIAFLIYSTVVLSGFSFSEKTYLDAYFPDGNGLKAGDTILVSGLAAGSVRSVDYQDSEPDAWRVKVVLEFDRPVTLRQGYRMRISESTLLGGRVVDIDPGSSAAAAMAPDQRIVGEVGPSALESLANLVEDNREDLEAILDNVREATDAINRADGVLGSLIHDQDVRDNLKDIVAELRTLSEDLQKGEGTVGMLLKDEVVRQQLADFVRNGADGARRFREIAEDLYNGRGTFGALIKDPEVRADTVELLANLADSAAGLKEIVDKSNHGDGLVARILNDAELAGNVADFLDDLSVLGERLTEGDGSLALLMRESEVYQELMAALQTLNGTLEDAREAQPVSSFAGLLFQGF
ncbi:MAG: MCE family protein [Planctomycetota bacterium]|nr:MAG: MCE family protein [Planctomycetota bacterium]